MNWCLNRFIITVGSCMFRLQRLVKDLLKQLQGQDSGQWANNKVSGLDRTLGEISRILEKQVDKTNRMIEWKISILCVVIRILIFWLYIKDQMVFYAPLPILFVFFNIESMVGSCLLQHQSSAECVLHCLAVYWTVCCSSQVMPALWRVSSVMSCVWLKHPLSHTPNVEYRLLQNHLPVVIG